ncbi:MAG: histidine kinase [Gammaproteobacteria bacterium]
MPRRLQAAGNGWLVSHGEVVVYAYSLIAFWIYTTLTRVFIRALWYRSAPMAEATSPEAFAFVHAAFAPALLMAYGAAYAVGLPAFRRRVAVAIHFLIFLFVLIMAKLAYLVVNWYLMTKAHESGVTQSLLAFWMDPWAALGASIELASLYCVGLLLAAGVVNSRRYHLEAIARAELALDAERSRGMSLRRQLDPHSLYNTLNAIAGSVRSAPMIAIEMLSSLGELLRLTLRDDVAESKLDDEFAVAAKYLALYQLRFPDRLSIEVTLPENCRDAAIPPLLLQPLVENAALHGVNCAASAVIVRVSGSELTSDRIQVTISNTCSPATVLLPPAESSGIGLRNTWERLQLSYGHDFALEWMPCVGNTACLRLEIPRVIPAQLGRTDARLAPASNGTP